ncbi:hypothetical protein WEI85_23055 [Actinomycetes bacterium KLBMP 9797]
MASIAEGSINPAAVAGQYSAFAGLLTGFAFSGLVLYIGRQASAHQLTTVDRYAPPTAVRAADVAASLFYAMTSLGLCAFLYANLSGERPTSGRALTAMLLYGTVLGLSVLSLWHSLTLMMFEHELTKNAARYAYWVVVVVGPAIVMRFLAGVCHEAWEVRCAVHPTEAPCGWRVTPVSVGLVLLFLMLGLSALITALGIPRYRRHGGPDRRDDEFTLFGRVWNAALAPLARRRDMLAARPSLPGVGVFLLAALVMLASLFVTTRSTTITPPHWLIFGVLVAGFFLLGCFAFACGSIIGTRVGVRQNWLRKMLRRPRHARRELDPTSP